MIGDAIAHYRITAKLGEGGMGEVYRARDTKLDRDVAIKILPSAFAQDADRMARFRREAQVLASLNHPNIAHVYGVEERALVMELVEGETLKGPLAIETALNYAKQIVDALEAAHEKGITHRDLKPANIMITPAGVIKVLDFGLAAVTLPSSVHEGDPSNSPTLTMRATQAGMIMGTAAYMSPEQAAGKSVDKRADIWSFGVVLWEMLIGKQLFTGETVSHVLAAVLTKDPDLTQVPTRVRRLLRSCLQKDAKQRLQAIGDWRLLLEEQSEATAPSRSRLGIGTSIVALLLLVALGILSFVHFRETPPEMPLLRATILPPEGATLDFANGLGLPALSPDGKKIVFGARTADSKNPLWVRRLDSSTAQPLAGTEGATFPFWSPDSRFIAFFAEGKLKKVEASGGPALTLADAPLGRGGSWSRDGVIVFAPVNTASPLLRVSSAGGVASPINSARGRLPWFLPDGRHFVYQGQFGAVGNQAIRVGSLDGSESRVVTEAGSNAVYAQGYLLYLREGTLMAQPFDPRGLVVTGEAIPVAEQIQTVLNSGTVGVISVSEAGMLAFRNGAAFNGLQLTSFDRGGDHRTAIGAPASFNDFRLSPDGKRLAASVADRGKTDIWVYDIARGLRTRLTFGPTNNIDAVWSSDGRSVAFRSQRQGQIGLYRKSADNVGAEELLYADNLDKRLTSWSAEGRFLLYNAIDPKTGLDLWVLPLMHERPGTPLKSVRVLQTPANEVEAEFSPDSKWIAYTSNESQRNEVYVASFSSASFELGGKQQVSTAGGRLARWRRDGKEIFYVAPGNRLMAAEVIPKGAALEIGQVRPLFDAADVTTGTPLFDVSADGQHFLFRTFAEQESSEPLTLVQNWTAGLKK